jgi:hypothetical protein
MTEIKRRKHGFGYTQKWFARRATSRDALRFVAYLQFQGNRPLGPFVRRSFSTVLIDLGREPDAIMADMQKNVRYKIRRAENDDLSWEAGVDEREFLGFHEAFAKDKGIEGVELSRIRSLGSALHITRVRRNGQVLVQHAYLVDGEEGRSRQLFSATGRFENTDSALIGRANRWCHWKDMLYFKDLGVTTFDLGGIKPDTHDRTIEGINEFKQGFGGKLVCEDHWLSPLYALAGALRLR